MRILIDGQALQTDSRERGIGRYTEGLIAGLCKSKAEVVVLLNGSYEPRCSEALRLLREKASKARIEFFYLSKKSCHTDRPFVRFLAERLYFEAVYRIDPDVFLCPSLFEPSKSFVCPPLEVISKRYPVATVCYDFIPLVFADAVTSGEREEENSYFSRLRSLAFSDCVLCISQFTERQLCEIYPGIKTKVIWGASFSEVLPPNFSKGNYIFYCGGLDDRKNVEFLCNAYEQLPAEDRQKHPLRICYRKKNIQALELYEQIKSRGMAQQIFLVEADTDQELAQLYAQSFLFVFPSLYEGLGLPLIEALTFHVPILTSQATSLPEVVDNPDAWFDPRDEKQLTEKIHRAITDSDFLKRLQKYSDENQNKFSWGNTCASCFRELEALVAKKEKKAIQTNVNPPFLLLSAKMKYEMDFARIQQGKRTIYFDVSEYIHIKRHTGIPRTVQKFLQYLPSQIEGYNFDFVLVATLEKDECYRAIDVTNETLLPLDVIEPARGDWFVAVDFAAKETLRNKELLRLWKKTGVKLFFYVYDLVYIDFPQFVYGGQSNVNLLTRWLRFVVTEADCIISDSQTVSNRVIQWANEEQIDVSKTKFITHHLGSDFKSEENSAIEKRAKGNPIFQFISVSTIEPRKGYKTLISSFIKAMDLGMKAQLIIVGRPGWEYEDVVDLLIRTPYFGKSIFWERNCSDDKLNELYSTSDCYVFASYNEGFGIGIVEAAKKGLPLLLRDTPVFHEVAGDCALYFTEENLVDCLRAVASGKKKLPSVYGMEILTWEESIHQVAKEFIKLAKTDFYCLMKDPELICNAKSTIALMLEKNSCQRVQGNLRKSEGSSHLMVSIGKMFAPNRLCQLIGQKKSIQYKKLPFPYCQPMTPMRRLKYQFMAHFALTRKKRKHYQHRLFEADE